MSNSALSPDFPPEKLGRIVRNAYLSIPLYLLVPVVMWGVFRGFEIETNWAAVGIGVLGWMVALALRIPIMLPIKKWPIDRVTNLMASISGPLEEGIRWLALLWIGASFHMALSLGQGWAAIEVINTIGALVARANLLTRNDEKAMEAKKILDQQLSGIQSNNPMWGIVERIFASGFHIGSTLVIAFNPWLVILMMPVHSLFNYTVVHAVKKSLRLFVVSVVGFGGIVFTVGLSLTH